MKNKVKLGLNKKETSSSGENLTCPKCGGEMEVSPRQVVSKYPAPPLERFECSDNSCNYTRYVKLDSEDNSNSSDSKPRKELK